MAGEAHDRMEFARALGHTLHARRCPPGLQGHKISCHTARLRFSLGRRSVSTVYLFSPNRLSSASSSDDLIPQASKTKAADGRGIGHGTRHGHVLPEQEHSKSSLGFFRSLVPTAGWEIEASELCQGGNKV